MSSTAFDQTLSPATVTSAAPTRRPRRSKRNSASDLAFPGTSNEESRDGTDDDHEDAAPGSEGRDTWIDRLKAPFLMVSFLLSLFFVDRQQRAWRVSQSTSSLPLWSRLNFRNWLDPEPYQDPDDTTWGHARSSGGPHSWSTHKKHRKMVKLELSDAFASRGRVAVIVSAMMLLLLGLMSWILFMIYDWMFS